MPTLPVSGSWWSRYASSAAERKAAVTVAATLALEAGAHSLTVDQPDILRNAVKVVDRVYHGDEAD